MAVYHCSLKVVSRGDGRSAVAASAYRSGQRLEDERLGQAFDYTRREVVADAFILLPPGAAADLVDRGRLWNQAEAAEGTRINARTAREIEISLPRELTLEQGVALVHTFARAELVDRFGVGVDVGIHNPRAADGADNSGRAPGPSGAAVA